MREINTESTRRHRSQAEEEWLVRGFEQSGLSRKAFCTARGVALHTLDYYRHRDRVRRPVGGAEQLVANRRRVVVEAGFDASHLKRLLAVLEG